ncbi:RNA polymerase sigma-70 factor [Aureibaculum sp. 2210JD6-5]|uniref:RNA polymerase sigma-70 factor n=1 Tax=Aureibaculum sp. 2210JD6-5 TaxID=3103957 RepID=UPI002AACDB6A|nr:RNA polymerase sigma-70 factor [Aureibaculum sp. 2210JD6-5]MDY7394334.1 RNA polymerase sigma-70 factor [Aureibaculum sp. 2210JD6-5]
MESDLIIRQINNNDRVAFKGVFQLHYDDLVRYANNYLYDLAASEDIVQDVFIYIWEHSSKIKIEKSLNSYLHIMVRNRCLNYLKALKITDNSNFLELTASLITENTLDNFLDDDKKIIYNQILKIVESMPDKMQKVFKLKFLSGYKYAEIAIELGVSINTVKTQLKRAKFKINESISIILILLSNQ